MRRFISLFALSMCFMMNATAQIKVSGTIVEEANGKGVPFVNVGLFRQADSVFVSGTASDDKGHFELLAPNGEYRLAVSAIGFQTYEQLLNVEGNQDLGQLKLKEGSTRLEEVVITEKRPLFAVEGEKTMYNVSEDPSIQTGTLSDALQNAPGVLVDVEGNITLRGTSSVEVWINDKPLHMNEENLKNYIQQLPANSIDHVEVITNPSARYGSKAEGIINIVTKAKVQKNEFFSFGVNGSTRPSLVPWMSYVWSNDKLTVNAYLNGGYFVQKRHYLSEESLYTDGHSLAIQEVDSLMSTRNRYSLGCDLSLDYEIDTANSLNVWLMGWPDWNDGNEYYDAFRMQFEDIQGVSDTLITDYVSSAALKYRTFFVNGGLNYQHDFDNERHNLSVSAYGMVTGYNAYFNNERNYVLPFIYDWVDRVQDSRRNIGGETEIVYNRPYSENGELSIGLNSSYSPEKEVYIMDTLVEVDKWDNDKQRSHRVNYSNLSNEVFVTMQHKFGGFTVKPGIRFCSDLIGGAYPDSSQYDFSKHFFSVRPSLHLSYRTKSMHNFKLNYTRRITVPVAQQLGAFPMYYVDSYSKGNPDLERIYTNTIEAGWTKYWDDFGSIGLSTYFRGMSNEVNDIQLSNYHWLYGRVVSYSYLVNVGKSHNLGMEYNMVYRPSGFFNLRFYANLYNSYIYTEYEGRSYEFDKWSYSFDLYLWAKLWNKVEVTASGYYSSPTQSLFSENHAYYGINAGLRADFFDRRMSVFINANDIFDWNSRGKTSYSPYVESSYSSKYNTRRVSVGLVFRFGKMELESRARQSTDDSGGAPQGIGM